jgi:hypothetical protein
VKAAGAGFRGPIAAPDRRGRIGFYGCSRDGSGRVVRIAWAGKGRPPGTAEVACPVCEELHQVEPMWRAPVVADREREPDVELKGASIS